MDQLFNFEGQQQKGTRSLEDKSFNNGFPWLLTYVCILLDRNEHDHTNSDFHRLFPSFEWETKIIGPNNYLAYAAGKKLHFSVWKTGSGSRRVHLTSLCDVDYNVLDEGLMEMDYRVLVLIGHVFACVQLNSQSNQNKHTIQLDFKSHFKLWNLCVQTSAWE